MKTEHHIYEHNSCASRPAACPPKTGTLADQVCDQHAAGGYGTLRRDVEGECGAPAPANGQPLLRVIDESSSTVFAPISYAYLRESGSGFSQRDRADLKAYLDALRQYYDVPDGTPVFPAPIRSDNVEIAKRPKPRPGGDARSRADHPWRSK